MHGKLITTSPPSKILPCGRATPQGPKRASDSKALLANMRARLGVFVIGKKLNKTEARDKILETIVTEVRHFRAQDLLERLKARHPEVGKATLYRNLPVLVESGILQEGPSSSDGQTFYELVDGDHHDHIVCLDCRHIFEFHDDVIERRQDSVTQKLGFQVRSHHHVIYASCEFK